MSEQAPKRTNTSLPLGGFLLLLIALLIGAVAFGVVQFKGKQQLQNEVASCGDQGCESRIRELEDALEKAKKSGNADEVGRLKARIAELEAENADLKKRLTDQLSYEQGRKVQLEEVARVGPFPIGSFELTDEELGQLAEKLAPYKDSPLLVIGIADNQQYKGPSAELKQLGLMIARAQLVERLGIKELFYQVRQGDPEVPDSRGIRVFRMVMGNSPTKQVGGPEISAPVPTFIKANPQ